MNITCLGFLFAFQCQVPATPPASAPYCDIARPIYWAPGDTRETKEQADRENRKWKRLCGPSAEK